MAKFNGADRVGLRDKDTNKLVAVYPYKLGTNNFDEVEDKVKFWYYQQSCDAEDVLENCYVDALNENELKQLNQE